MIIIEGKKEDVAKQLKMKFEYDAPFIDQMLSIDPTGYKYVDYIGRQLEKIIPKLAGQKGGLNVSQQSAIQSTLSNVIPWFHRNQNKITEDDVWKAETNFRNANGETVSNIEGISRQPKDINQYENPSFITFLMNVVDERKTEKELEREAKSQVTKLYEDDDVLVVMPKSYVSSCYYGANTKWCTTTRGSSGYFEKYSRDGKLYYFINKKTGLKRALYIKEKPKQVEVYNEKDIEVGLDELFSDFPQQIDLIDDLVGVSDFIKTLKLYARGQASERDLLDSDDSIYRIIPNKIPGQSELIIEFPDDNVFFKALDLGEDDQWFLNAVTSYYGDYEFMDSYTGEEDWKEGYIVYGFLNDENKKLLQKICSVVLPDLQVNFEELSYEDKQKINKTLIDLFPDEIDAIITDYVVEVNSEATQVARDRTSKEINDALENGGFELIQNYDRVKTTVANFIMWSHLTKLTKIDAISLFNRIIDKTNRSRIGGWYENTYEFRDDEYFDTESFNREVGRQFDKILEELEDEENPISEFLEFRLKIVEKFGVNKWNKLPIDKNVEFKVEGFDREKMKVNLLIEKQYKGTRRLKLSEEQFNQLLYQPQLFDLFGED